MTTISISQLKANPSAVINQAVDYPIAVQNRNKVQGYLVGKDLWEKLIKSIENNLDYKTIKKTDFKEGRDFEDIAQELGI